MVVSRISASFEGRIGDLRPAGAPHTPGSCALPKCVRHSAEDVPSICMGEWVGVKCVFGNLFDCDISWIYERGTLQNVNGSSGFFDVRIFVERTVKIHVLVVHGDLPTD